MSSFWKTVIMNLQEKCIFSCGKKKKKDSKNFKDIRAL